MASNAVEKYNRAPVSNKKGACLVKILKTVKRAKKKGRHFCFYCASTSLCYTFSRMKFKSVARIIRFYLTLLAENVTRHGRTKWNSFDVRLRKITECKTE